MLRLRSVAGRVAVGKTIGFLVGLLCIVLLPTFGYPGLSMFGLGTLLMFMLMGVMTGFMGQMDRHPVFDFQMPFWLRGGMVGFAFMLMYILLSYNDLTIIMQSAWVSWTGLVSPFWALIDGVTIGILMGWLETKFCGEGKDLPII